MLIGGIHDWETYFEQAFASLKPGRWLETQEVLCPMHSEAPESQHADKSTFLKWSHSIHKAAARVGINLQAPYHFKDMLGKAGFVDIDTTMTGWHVGAWGKDEREKKIGEMQVPNLRAVSETLSAAFLSGRGGWSADDVSQLVKEVREDLSENLISKKYVVSM